jgi:hypothetical protein
MTAESEFEIFLVAAPGLESALCEEVQAKGFAQATAIVHRSSSMRALMQTSASGETGAPSSSRIALSIRWAAAPE